MSEAHKIKSNSFYSTLSYTARLIANVIMFWILARFYDPESFGKFTFAHTLATTFILLADFGFDILLTTEIARNRGRASEIFQQFFSLKLIFTIVAMFGMWIFAFFMSFDCSSRQMIVIFSLFMVFTAFTNFLYALFRGVEQLGYEGKVSIIMNISLLIIVIVLIVFNVNIIIVASGFTLSRMIGSFSGIKFSRIVLPSIKYKLIYQGLSKVKGKILIYGFHFFFSYLFFQLDTILIGLFKGDYYVGIYQAVFKLVMLPLAIPEILINVLIPTLSRLNLENKVLWERIGCLFNKLLLIIIMPISIVFFAYADQIINLIYGAKYISSINVLRVFALIIFVRFCFEPFALMLTTSERQKYRMIVVIIATILNFVLNYFSIPKYGVLGAAIISLITNGFVGIAYLASNIQLLNKWLLNLETLGFVILTSISIGILWLLKDVNFIIGILIVLLFFTLNGLVYLTKEERTLLINNFVRFNLLQIKSVKKS